MSKSLGNVKTVKHVLENWGPNIIRLFCLSGHYSKPIDYSEDLLKENLAKWRQVEQSYFELIHAKPDDGGEDVEGFVSDCRKRFDSSFENDFNTHLALSAFFNLVKEVNRLAASDKIVKSKAQMIMSEFQRMLNILGLKIPTISEEEINSINKLLKTREILRGEKKYQEADKIRDQISEKNIELIDHGNRTTWMKKEKIRLDIA